VSAPASFILCAGCRARGACQFGVMDQVCDGMRSQGRITCPRSFEGLPGIAHGGWIAGAFDDVMGRFASNLAQSVHTTTLTIDFLRPVPVEHVLHFTVEGEAHAQGWRATASFVDPETEREYARAHGRFALPRRLRG